MHQRSHKTIILSGISFRGKEYHKVSADEVTTARNTHTNMNIAAMLEAICHARIVIVHDVVVWGSVTDASANGEREGERGNRGAREAEAAEPRASDAQSAPSLSDLQRSEIRPEQPRGGF